MVAAAATGTTSSALVPCQPGWRRRSSIASLAKLQQQCRGHRPSSSSPQPRWLLKLYIHLVYVVHDRWRRQERLFPPHKRNRPQTRRFAYTFSMTSAKCTHTHTHSPITLINLQFNATSQLQTYSRTRITPNPFGDAGPFSAVLSINFGPKSHWIKT